MQLQSHRRGAIERKMFVAAKKTAQEQLCFLNIHILQPRQSQATPPPLLLGLVRLVCGEEGHTVGPEVGVEVSGLVETPTAHLADQIPLSVLALRLRGGGRGAVGRAVSARGAAFRVAVGVPHSVSDEAVPAKRTG